jgi:predicted DNA-binding protein YlxM (UPF0122 family)
MAEELTSTAVAPETPSVPSEQAPASQSEPRPQTPERTPETREEKSTVNLQEFPEFKKYQRTTNQTIEQIRQQFQDEIARRDQEIEKLMTRDLSDEELTQREIDKRDRLLAEKDKQMQELYQSYAKDLAMNEIAKKTGVPASVFEDADNPDEAWELAFKTAMKNTKAELEAQYKNALASQPGNTPDLGGAEPTPPKPAASQVPKFNTNSDLVNYYRQLHDEMNE